MSEHWGDVDRVALRASAEAGVPAAMHNLGMIAYYERDVTTALKWLREAARRGFNESIYNLGVVLWGQGRTEEGEPWQIAAANAGTPEAMWNLAGFHNMHGRPDVATIWRKRAEAMGYRPGDDDDGLGLPADVEASFREKGLPREDGPT
jgi:TPR repeat protein